MGDIKLFNNQNYFVMRKEQRQNPSTLFLDETFVADDNSINPLNKIENFGKVEWKRPSEICETSCLFANGLSVHDVCQGNLGNCWLISALAVLALHPDCLKKVIPDIDDQEWHGKNPNKYTGMFRCCFWRFGEWIEVVIDDRLPSKNGNLLFAHSKDKNEFWCALIEKAYAKVCGSYESLIGGLTCESLVDFTGGIPEQIFDIKKYSATKAEMEVLFRLLKFDSKDGSLICTSIASRSEEMEEKLSNGLITTHAYSITGVCQLDIRSSPLADFYKENYLMCLKIRNPWGMREYTGPLSDGSPLWNSISMKDKLSMGYKCDNDGEFWILFIEFLKFFNQITIVRLIKDGIFRYNSNWYGSMGKGYWTGAACDRKSALSEVGGGGQFLIKITKPGGDIVLVHLLQKCARGCETGLGLIIAEVEGNRNFMIHSESMCTVKLEYRLGGSRSICLRYRLQSGTYILKGFLTVQPLKATFPIYYLLRCYTTKKNYGMYLSNDFATPGTNCFCKSKAPSVISRLNLVQADVTANLGDINLKHIYCEISCEDQVFRTNLNDSSIGLQWNQSFLFYRQRLNEPVVVKIMNKGFFFDSPIGCASYYYDPNQINAKQAIETVTPIFDPNLRSVCSKLNNLKANWYHTDNIMNL